MNKHTDNVTNRVIEFPDSETLEDQAAKWVAKLDITDPSEATIIAFKQWINQSPEHRSVFEKHMALWNDMNVLTRMVPPAHAESKAKPKQPGFYVWWKQGLMVCAVLTIVIGLLFNARAPEVYITDIGEQKTVKLADGTSVLMNTNTKLLVKYSGELRAVYLSYGEAHFDVVHNPNIPFDVYAGRGKVRAVGTAFTVYLRSDDVEVVVTEGSVEILPAKQPQDNASPTIAKQPAKVGQEVTSQKALAPEQEPLVPAKVEAGNIATYDRHTAEHIMLVALGEDENKLSWHKGMLVFRSEPLEDVIAVVNRYTEFKIVIPDQKVRALKVGGFFKVTEIDSVFDALEKGFDIHAEVVSDSLVYLIHREE